MSQINRLHGSDIANGNLIDADHLNNEFNQLVVESNNQDTRLTTAESNITSVLGGYKGLFSGLLVQYSTPSRVTIGAGICRDASQAVFMDFTSTLTVDLSASGAGGLDTGTEAANTWYYVWLIRNSTTGGVSGLFSTSNLAPTLPSGYDKKRLLPIAVKNDASSNLIPYTLGSGWPSRPEVIFDASLTTGGPTQVLNAGTANTYTDVSLAAYVPPISRLARLSVAGSGSNSNNYKTKGANFEVSYGLSGANTLYDDLLLIPTDSAQTIQYKCGTGASSSVRVAGFVVTEV